MPVVLKSSKQDFVFARTEIVTLLKIFPSFSPRVTPNLSPGLQSRKMEIQGDQGALYDDSCAAHDMMRFY